jgi:hypothetical protein
MSYIQPTTTATRMNPSGSFSLAVPVLSLFVVVMAITITPTLAFIVPFPSSTFTSPSSSSSSSQTTTLYISSWTSSSAKNKWGEATLKNPEERIQDYLKEPTAVEARTTINGICLVSGVVNAQDRTDQFLYDLLNHEDSAFEFTKIIAFVNDAKFSKKRLLSRSARYTGLLDKLDFLQAEVPNGFPTVEQLKDVTNWVAVLGADNNVSNEEKLQQMQQITSIVTSVSSTLQNVAILVMNANELDVMQSQNILSALQNTGVTYTMVVVGTIEERPEGNTFYHYKEFGTNEGIIPNGSVFSREESYRMITELLQLQAGSNRALSFAEIYNTNITEAKLIKGLREAGYARPQEIDHMIQEGPQVSKIQIYIAFFL